MGDGTTENPYTREDVLRLIEANGGKAEGLDLSGKVFEKRIDLGNAYLKGANLRNTHFEEAKLGFASLEKSNLRDAHLEEAELWEAHLEGANFGSAHLEGANLRRAYLEGAQLVEANFEKTFLQSAHLEGAYLIDTHFEGADFSFTHLEGAYLHGAQFSADTRLEAVDWGDYILGEEKGRQFDKAVDVYPRLKIWYTNAGIYDIAGKFFFREMTARRKALKWWPKPWNRAFSKILSMLCGYGEKPERVVVSALVIIFGLAIAYRFGGLSLPYSIYYSFASFTALGYGSWVPQPTDWVKGLGVAEAVIGVFMMALFLVTFTRKMTR